MKKRILSLLLCCVMLLGLMPTAVFAEGSTAPADITGSGTAENPYLIYTAEGLKQFRDIVNGENGKIKKSDAHAKLMSDIVLNDGAFDANGNYTKGASGKDAEEWTPIGTEEIKAYSGTFDGGGHTIKGLYVKDQRYAGLFGYVQSYSATTDEKFEFAIKDLTVTGYIGINSDNGKTVNAGGIIGRVLINADRMDVSGTVSGCVSHVVINARSTDDIYAGGIVGYVGTLNSNNHTANMEITNCANHAAVTAHSENSCVYVGGIAGEIAGASFNGPTVQKIDSCFNAGRISGGNGNYYSNYVGGIIGHASGNSAASSVDNCLNVGEVTETAGKTGGIAGTADKISISNCCNTGKVGENGGGIANRVNDASVSNCYYLDGTANIAYRLEGSLRNDGLKTEAEFADGTVLNLLKNGDENSPWEKCGYLNAARMIVPLLKGQTADTFPIYTVEDLKAFRDVVNSGETGANAKLMNDIDLGGEQWTPIANYTGTFDGNGKTVSGLNVKDVVNAGLFGTLSGSAVVKNLTVAGSVEASNTNESAYAGGIAAKIGGSARIINCVNNAAVKATVNNDVDAVYTAYAGGMAGHVDGNARITGCTNNGTVAADSNMASAYTGGMAGYTEGVVIENCLNTAELSAVARGSRYLSDGVTEYDNIQSRPVAGGMVGFVFDVTVTGCYNTGAVTAKGTGDYPQQPNAGGMIGFSSGGRLTVTDCGNTGKITASATIQSAVGGIVGSTRANDGTIFTVSHCYSTGELSSDDHTRFVGGIAGIAYAYQSTYTISDCYWLTGSCGKGVGYNSENSVAVTGTEAYSKSDFANGTVLELLKQNDTNNAWDVCGYVEAADMTLPLLHWQVLNARKYDIYISGVQITSLNQNDVLGDGKVSFTYDDVNKKGTLTLDGVNIVCNDFDDAYPIDASEMENLEIVLKGKNNIEAEWVAGIMADNLTFSGEGSIEISTDGNYNWPVTCDRTFTVNGGNVKISSIDYALLLDGALTVTGGTLELIATGEDGYAIDIGRNKLNVVLADDRIMITGKNPDGSDAGITAASEVDTIKEARYVKILSKYIPIVYALGQYGTGDAVTQNKTYGVDFGLSDALFTRTGYKQIGWALSDGGDKAYELGSAYTGNEPLTLYPVWEAEQYSITYNPNGGTIGSGNVTGYTYGVGATLPTDVTRTGYTFDGWYDNAAFSGTTVTSISDTDSGNKTYYAKWTENSNYIVIFISNGGTLTNDKKTVKWTDKILDGVADPTRNGYVFAGWKYVNTVITADMTYADLAVTDDVQSITLAAQWRDVAPPTGEIKIAENGWKSFLNTITFGLFFKDTQTVTVTAADNSGEAVTIEYLLSDKVLTESELAGMTFTAYAVPFAINPDNEYVIYVKLTDTSGNVAYINTDGIVLDATMPVISGIEAGKTYCAAQTVTVTEKYIDTVTVNGAEITLDENNQFTLFPAVRTQTVVVTDKAGNETTVAVTVNDGHTGGTATCTDKAICEVCGENYGELDGNNHADMKHIEAKAETKTAEGNTEYWYCEGCGKYFADKDGLKEITKADTVTAKLPEEKPTSPKTSDTSNLALWIALLFISGGAVTATTVISKKKKHSKE